LQQTNTGGQFGLYIRKPVKADKYRNQLQQTIAADQYEDRLRRVMIRGRNTKPAIRIREGAEQVRSDEENF